MLAVTLEGESCVKVVDIADSNIRTVAGDCGTKRRSTERASNGAASSMTFGKLGGCQWVGSHVYFAELDNHVVRRVHVETMYIDTFAGIPGEGSSTGDGGAAISATLDGPTDVVYYDGIFYLSSWHGR